MKKQLNRSELLGSLPVKRAVLMQILPAIASQMVALAYGIADTYFVGLLNAVSYTHLTLPTILRV